jgi:hypothetical protein
MRIQMRSMLRGLADHDLGQEVLDRGLGHLRVAPGDRLAVAEAVVDSHLDQDAGERVERADAEDDALRGPRLQHACAHIDDSHRTSVMTRRNAIPLAWVISSIVLSSPSRPIPVAL